MAKYSEEFKYSIMMKRMPPHNQSVSVIARETGLSSEATLQQWRKQARVKGMAVLGHGEFMKGKFDQNPGMSIRSLLDPLP